MINHSISFGFGFRSRAAAGIPLREENRLDHSHSDPLSADPNIWPVPKQIADVQKNRIPEPLNPFYMANSLKSLFAYCEQEGISRLGLDAVCITADSTIQIALDKLFGAGYFSEFKTEDELLRDGWTLRGYDVVNPYGLISGLKGCGYSEPTWKRLRQAYANDLNDDGLFQDICRASRFAVVRGIEIRQHAPFVPMGLLTKQIDE